MPFHQVSSQFKSLIIEAGYLETRAGGLWRGTRAGVKRCSGSSTQGAARLFVAPAKWRGPSKRNNVTLAVFRRFCRNESVTCHALRWSAPWVWIGTDCGAGKHEVRLWGAEFQLSTKHEQNKPANQRWVAPERTVAVSRLVEFLGPLEWETSVCPCLAPAPDGRGPSSGGKGAWAKFLIVRTQCALHQFRRQVLLVVW